MRDKLGRYLGLFGFRRKSAVACRPLGYRVYGMEFRNKGLGIRVQGLAFRVKGSGFRFEGLGVRVWV